MSTLIATYSESNVVIGSTGLLWSGHQPWQFEAFQNISSNYTLDNVILYLRKSGTLTGNITAKIYSHTGTFGTNGVPNALLATSDNVLANSISASPTFALQTFTFSGINRITLTPGTAYCLVISYVAGDNGNRLEVGSGTTAGVGTWGRSVDDNPVDGWTFSLPSAGSTIFYVYGIAQNTGNFLNFF